MASRKKRDELKPRNRLLAALTRPQLDSIRHHLALVAMRPREVIIDANKPIKYVYFVETGGISVVGIMRDGTAVETATIGYELMG